MQTKRFKKFLKREKKKKNQQTKRYNRKFDFGSTYFTYFVVESWDTSRLSVQIWCTRRKVWRRRTIRMERQRELI